ncbi:MAG: FtsX-like permease family protein [Actinobacteria bacterium]|nr:FtsX-like permease family protein [Actinomycetota bacterium]
MSLTWARGLATRRLGRLSAAACGVAIAVALLAAIGSFLSAAKATMTARAAADVAVDWQVQTQPGADSATVLATVKDSPGVTSTAPVGYAVTSGLEATTGGSTQSTGPGVVLGIPDAYRTAFPGELRDLTGAGAGVLLAQQTAANLHAAPGDTVTVGRAGLPPVTVRVDGVVDLPQADSLFQSVGAPAGAQPQAPPDNVVLLPAKDWHGAFDPVGTARPDLVHTQIHVRLAHHLPNDPAAAYAQVSRRARNLEARLAGTANVGNNLAATLDAARSDALYAQMLFLFLGLPGAVLAGLLTAAVAGAGAERRRKEQALLRARGASGRHLARLGGIEAVMVGAVGTAIGLAAAFVVGHTMFGAVAFGATTATTVAWAAGSAAVGFVIAAATVALPAWRDSRSATVAAGRRAGGWARRPRWLRFGLDLVLLAGGTLVFWLTARSGYQLVLAPEGVPTLSVSYWAFAGPAMLWSGAGLFAWRVADTMLGRGRTIMRGVLRPVAGPLAGTVAASMSRQRSVVARALALVALTAAFAASTAVFNATYRQQADIDARLTNGGDVTVTESPGTSTGASARPALATIPGVRSVEPIQHRFAYVGADLQDLYGVRPATIVDATKLQDAYFQGGTARQLVATLAAHPDSILVSAETVKDFQLHPGDELTLRLQDGRTKQFTNVVFHYAGVAKEFPTAPHDSFLVANAAYIAKTTGSDAVGAFLLDTGRTSPRTVARRVRSIVGAQAQVTDLTTSRRVVGSSLTAVDLAGLTRLELAFALVLAAASTGLVLALGIAERRRTFAIARALGAKNRQLGAFVWAEALFVTGGGLVLGALAGFVLSHTLVKVLTGVFDPPPAALAVPWAYLTAVGAAAVGAVTVAAFGAIRASQRPPIALLRDL